MSRDKKAAPSILTPFLDDADVILYAGDCIEVMREMPEASVDAIITDPPYGLEFMGKEWDSFAEGRGKKYKSGGKLNATKSITPKGGTNLPIGPSYTSRPAKRCAKCGKQAWSGSPCQCDAPEWIIDNSPLRAFQSFSEAWAREAYRVLKPGGHLLAFAGTRTYHRMASGVEDAGFEIRDAIAWMYGSGFPKSLDVSKAIDKAAGAERTEQIGVKPGHEKFVGRDNLKSLRESGALSGPGGYSRPWMHDPDKVEAAHHLTAPATPEAAAWNGWGTALKPAYEPIVVARKPLVGTVAENVLTHGTGALNIDATRIGVTDTDYAQNFSGARGHAENRERASEYGMTAGTKPASGRWPANVALDETAAAMLDQQSGWQKDGTAVRHRGVTSNGVTGWGKRPEGTPDVSYNGAGGASRFFYTAKASRHDRNQGALANNTHPTVKPTELMRWLIRLVTPPGGIILDPFGGSGSTGVAARAENVRCILIEREPEYLNIIRDRLAQQSLFADEHRDNS
jgi:site-specific DNA-methyltransferase (adenine-specific)